MKQHILGFFDSLVRTPAFLFLCAMFLCGALAGGLTGLHASEGDSAVELTAMLSALPEQVLKSVLCAALWLVLPVRAGSRARLCDRADGRRKHRAGGGRAAFAPRRGAARGVQRVCSACCVRDGLAERGDRRPVFAARLPRAVCAVRADRHAERAAARRDRCRSAGLRQGRPYAGSCFFRFAMLIFS